jgi:hypothetical protein
MKLIEFTVENARGVTAKAKMPAVGPLVVTGAAGVGKTALLEAIIAAKENAGAYGLPPRTEDFLSSDVGRVELVFEQDKKLSLDESETLVKPAVAHRLRTFKVARGDWKMEYFPWARCISDMGPGPQEGAFRLTKLHSKYGFVRRYLESLVHEEAVRALSSIRLEGIALAEPADSERSRFSAALALLCPSLRWDGCERMADRSSTWFVRPTGPRVELNCLTDGEKMAVIFAASWAALGLDRALVLIDHPELGIHPAQQVAFFDGLVALAGAGQLIVTTTSPAILRSTPTNSVLVLS